MTTVINSPGESSDSALGIIFGVLLAIGLIVLFLVYGLPAIRSERVDNGGVNLNITLPNNGSGTGSSSSSANY